MMRFFNLHTHSRYCDGSGEPEEYVISAIEENMSLLGFSSHAPLPFRAEWSMEASDLPAYRNEIQRLRKRYSDKISILLGLEIDYIPGSPFTAVSRYHDLNLDYTIGSVHFAGRYAGGEAWGVDFHEEKFKRGLEEIYNGDFQRVVERYYELIGRMTAEEPYDIIGHLDYVKYNNRNERYFSEQAGWYKDALYGALKKIATSKKIVEVNTGGLARGTVDSLFPSEWIIHECKKLEIPVLVSSDAHSPLHLTSGFSEAIQALRNAGYKKITVPAGKTKRNYIDI